MKENDKLIEQISKNVLEKLYPYSYLDNNDKRSECSVPKGSLMSSTTKCEVISNENIEKLKNISSPTVCNAIESFKVRDETDGYTTSELRCMRPELRPMVGYAITVTIDTTTPASLEKRKFSERFDEIIDLINVSPKPAIVVYKDLGPQRNKTCITGDMVATCFSHIGAEGVVTDSCIRDLASIKKKTKNFQVFATGQVVSHGNMNILEIGGMVNVCGLIIRPGDLLHGDESGLVKIPLNFIKISQLIDKCNQITELENKYFNLISDSNADLDEIRKFFKAH